MALAHDVMNVANPTVERIILLRIKEPLTVDTNHLNYKTKKKQQQHNRKKIEVMERNDISMLMHLFLVSNGFNIIWIQKPKTEQSIWHLHVPNVFIVSATMI